MNSVCLKEKGFTDAIPLKELQFTSIPLNKNSVIVLIDNTATGKPASDILYIGKSKKPQKRIFGGYLAGYGGKTTQKIHSQLLDDALIDKVAVCWMTTDDSKTAQKQLLEEYKKDHGEYPKWNASKKPQPKSAKAPKVIKKIAPKKKPAKASH